MSEKTEIQRSWSKSYNQLILHFEIQPGYPTSNQHFNIKHSIFLDAQLFLANIFFSIPNKSIH